MEPFKTVESVADYATALKELGASGLDRPFWFRGHPHSGYRLRASALREDSLRKNQAIMLKRFMQDAQNFLVDAPSNRWEWLFLAQHHGVPTILLDWSENALIALYFASERAESQLVGVAPPNGDVWVLLPAKLNQTCGTWSGQHAEDLPLFGVDLGLEKYHPLELVSPQETRNPVAALATRCAGRQRRPPSGISVSCLGRWQPEHDEDAGRLVIGRRPACRAIWLGAPSCDPQCHLVGAPQDGWS